MTSLRLRVPVPDDAAAVARLAGQLGYATGVEIMRDRIARITAQASQFVRLAEAEDGAVVGWIHAGELELLETGPGCEIFGLVVDEAYRGHGAGRLLVTAAERWAADRGMTKVTVRSNIARDGSHPFYLRLGYERTKTQHVYRRTHRAEG